MKIINRSRLTDLFEYGLQHQIITDKMKDGLTFVYDVTEGIHHLTIHHVESGTVMSVHVSGFIKPKYKIIKYFEGITKEFNNKEDLFLFILREICK